MRIIKYQLCTEINHGTEDTPDIEQVLADVTLGWTESNLHSEKPTTACTPLRTTASRSLRPAKSTASKRNAPTPQ